MSNHASKEERLETKGYLLGISEGLHQASKWLELQSGESFKARDDKSAHLYRTASGEVAGMASKARERYDKEYPDNARR